MHEQESFLINETYKILWDLEKETNSLIPAKRSEVLQINKKKELASKWILHSGGPESENKSKQKDKTDTWTLPEN